MSYGLVRELCSICEKWVELNLDHEVRNGEALHTECAKEWDAEMGPTCKCRHSIDGHYMDEGRCMVPGCKCRAYDHAHGERAGIEREPTDAELAAAEGTR